MGISAISEYPRHRPMGNAGTATSAECGRCRELASRHRRRCQNAVPRRWRRCRRCRRCGRCQGICPQSFWDFAKEKLTKRPAKFTTAAQKSEIGADGARMSWHRWNAGDVVDATGLRRDTGADVDTPISPPFRRGAGCSITCALSRFPCKIVNEWSAKLGNPATSADVAPTDRDRGRCRRCRPRHVPILRFSKSRPSKSSTRNSATSAFPLNPPGCHRDDVDDVPPISADVAVVAVVAVVADVADIAGVATPTP